jgi:hypothetical protein
MFGYKIIPKEKLEEMDCLIRSLEALVWVAETDCQQSRAVTFVRNQLDDYYRKWCKR